MRSTRWPAALAVMGALGTAAALDVAGCDRARAQDDASTSIDGDPSALADRSLDVYDQIVRLVEATPDCEQAAAGIRAMLEREQDTLRAGVALSEAALTDPAIRHVVEAHDARSRALAVRMDAAFARCEQSQAFDDVLAELP
ncbi:MAG: hypothetical protein H6709_12920 [Kofleriaceae bacterium]|nr:hypothetical protein [Myxococcales bacterium]MCB9572980.1 hypothetical protein [Kofleriaceae bacterium]